MAVNNYKCPPQPASGQGTFSDNLVGLQLVDGGGLTQANFEFTTNITEKQNRTFSIGSFSDPISLDSLNIGTIEESKKLIADNFRVYPNFDLSQVTNFTMFGSFEKVQAKFHSEGKVFVFLGRGTHKIKRKAEQMACEETLKLIE